MVNQRSICSRKWVISFVWVNHSLNISTEKMKDDLSMKKWNSQQIITSKPFLQKKKSLQVWLAFNVMVIFSLYFGISQSHGRHLMDQMGSQGHNHLQLSLGPYKLKKSKCDHDIDMPNQQQNTCTVIAICKWK
jgi:hypothetical protein